MMKVTEFPPVTYSSSFVSYILKATNETSDSHEEEEEEENSLPFSSISFEEEENENEEEHNHHNHHHHEVIISVKPSSIEAVTNTNNNNTAAIKMRWQQIARDAFNYSLNQKLIQQKQNQEQQANNQNNHQTQNNHHNHSDDDSLKNLIDLIALTNNSHVNNKLLKCTNNHYEDDTWIQLSGHEGSFALAGPGTIWKKHSHDSTEIDVYEALMNEPIAEMVPKFYRNVHYKGDNFIELEDLLYHFKDASIMDIKMGTRTFLESEVSNKKLRPDLYDKMYRIDPNELTSEEHNAKAITKLRYMKFREDLSSSSNLGFRIEGFKVGKNVKHNKNLHTIKHISDVQKTLEMFFQNKDHVCHKIMLRLKCLRKHFEESSFFRRHEIIGSSLLIIYTADKCGVWMIDFAKTSALPEHIQINHRDPWKPGNHEDGYLFGLDNLISILENLSSSFPSSSFLKSNQSNNKFN